MNESVYGHCPRPGCGAAGVTRERRPNGNDRCARGHSYASRDAVKSIAPAATFTRYVCGFMFEPLGGVVVLVRKARPSWQAGKLNGVGGKVEGAESIHAAMTREFLEEAGVETQPADWDEFAVLEGPDFAVHFMRAFSDDWHLVRTMTDETVGFHPVSALPKLTIVDNLRFIIPLALDRQRFEVVRFKRDAGDEARAA